MNDTFNIKRFAAYAARDYRANWKRYAVQAGVLMGLLIAELVFLRVMNGDGFDAEDIRDMIGLNFGFVMSLGVVFFTIAVMKPLKNRHTLAVENTVPASLFEKYLFILLNTTVVFFAAFFLAYLLMAAFGIAVLGKGTFNDYFYNRGGMITRLTLWLVLPLQAGAMYAGTMERRRHMVSLLLVGVTAIAGLLLFVGGPMWISGKFYTAIRYGPMFLGNTASVTLPDTTLVYGLPPDIVNIEMNGPLIATCLAVVGTVMFWTAAWFNFRERSAK